MGGITLPNINTYSIDTIIKTVWYYQKLTLGLMEENKEPELDSHKTCPADF